MPFFQSTKPTIAAHTSTSTIATSTKRPRPEACAPLPRGGIGAGPCGGSEGYIPPEGSGARIADAGGGGPDPGLWPATGGTPDEAGNDLGD